MNRPETWIGAALIAATGALGFVLGPEYAAIGVVLALAAVVVLAARGFAYSYEPGPAVPRIMTPSTEEPAAPPDWRSLVWASIAVHVFAAFLLNVTKWYYQLAPDGAAYEVIGRLVAASWENPNINPLDSFHEASGAYVANSFYQNLNAAACYLLGDHVVVPLSILNGIIGTIAAVNIGKLASIIYGPQAGRRAFLLAAFFPSILCWTSMNLREAWGFLLISGAVLAAQRLRFGYQSKNVLILLACMGLMPFIRPYLLVAVCAGMAMSVVVVRLRNLPGAILSILVIMAVVYSVGSTFGITFGGSLESRLEQLNAMHGGLASGGSAYEQNVDISTPIGALTYFPKGLAIFLLAPFPWSIGSWRQAMAIPETMIWYYLLYLAGRSMVRGMRLQFSRIALPLFVAMLIAIPYALVEANEGTAYRHRAQFALLCFIFTASELGRKRSLTRAVEVAPALVRTASTA